jgi:ribosomal protein S18 acetylase RimI-like enzyme
VTTLLQRVRNAHPTKESFQAAEVQYWWSRPHPTDTLGQLFWFDDTGRPEAAVVATEFGEGASLVYDKITVLIVTMPDASDDWVRHVIGRGLDYLAELGIEAIDLEVDRADDIRRSLLIDRGFTVKGEAVIQCWLDADARPPISPLPNGYRLAARRDLMSRSHHMATPQRAGFEERLNQLSLYRNDLDLVILDRHDEPAAYALFWNDPATSTGVVEPVRTLDEHQGRGLSRHLLTSGIDRLADAGARRISIAYGPDNEISGHLYRSIGFVPHCRTELLTGPTRSPREQPRSHTPA